MTIPFLTSKDFGRTGSHEGITMCVILRRRLTCPALLGLFIILTFDGNLEADAAAELWTELWAILAVSILSL